MRRAIIFLSLLTLTQCITQPEPEKVPVVIYHMEGSQEAYGITETHDGNHYIISGWTDKGGEYYPPRCMLLKVDKEGNLVERKVFLSLEWDCGTIAKLGDSVNYIVRSSDNIVKINSNLDVVFKKPFPNMTYSFITDVLEVQEMETYYVAALYRRTTVYRIDDNGVILDSLTLPAVGNRSSVIETDASGNVYIAVQEDDTLEDRHGYAFVKLNSDLDSVLVNFIDVGEIFGYSAGYVTGMERFGDGTLLISALIVRGFLDGFSALFKVDSMGNIVKDTTIDYSMTAIEDMTKVEGGDIVLIGSALRDGYFFNFVMRLRPDLSVVWYKEFLEDFACSLAYASIIQDSDGNLAIAGYCAGLDDMAFMKLDSNTGELIVWSER